MPTLLFADDRGRVYDHPDLLAAVRSGDDVVCARRSGRSRCRRARR